eukprot:TRINITY_DN4956_c3_g1_i1.p1 TRINITY_DN4956_c3_g1~~TRINITY_DN4956_c3_g1_i1.p1  ORF type:complete len:1236 (+),score=418.21 TRINITY_DN4956_c3_g1_i1:48-3755(+)
MGCGGSTQVVRHSPPTSPRLLCKDGLRSPTPASPLASPPVSPTAKSVLPCPLVVELEKTGHLVCCHCADGGMTVACRASVTEKSGTETAAKLFVRELTAAALSLTIAQLRLGCTDDDSAPAHFAKLLATAFQTSRVAVLQHGQRVEFTLRQSREPKERVFGVDLTKRPCTAAAVYQHFVCHYPQMALARQGECAGRASKDKKELREADFRKAETDGLKKHCSWALSEASALAAMAAERRLGAVLPPLRAEADALRRRLMTAQVREAKALQASALRTNEGRHPLDRAYDGSAEAPEVDPVDVQSLCFDAGVPEHGLAATACSLLEYYGICDRFSIDGTVLRTFWTRVEGQHRRSAFHGPRHAVLMLCTVHHLLGCADKSASLRCRLGLTHEDVFAVLLAAGIRDLGHTGVDDAFLRVSGDPITRLYNDVHQTVQKSLADAFELMFDPAMNILQSLTPEEAKDVTESVREILFIKANVQLKSPAERLADIKLMLLGSVDLTAKDCIRAVLTLVVSVADAAPWLQRPAEHKDWMRLLAEELNGQADRAAVAGLPSTPWGATTLSPPLEFPSAPFAAAQTLYISNHVLPLLIEMQGLTRDADALTAAARDNRSVWESQRSRSVEGALSDIASFGKHVAEAVRECDPPLVVVGWAVPDWGPGGTGARLWLSACGPDCGYRGVFAESDLKEMDTDARAVAREFQHASADVSSPGLCRLRLGITEFSLQETNAGEELGMVLAAMRGWMELRRLDRMKDVEKQLEKMEAAGRAAAERVADSEANERALKACVAAVGREAADAAERADKAEAAVCADGGSVGGLDREEGLMITVRNPLKSPRNPDYADADGTPRDSKACDLQLLQLLKSKYYTKEGGAPADLAKQVDAEKERSSDVVLPLVTSEFSLAVREMSEPDQRTVYNLIQGLDKWDFDVFEVQTAMSGGICEEHLRKQPRGGALFVTAYALFYKWQFMQKFNISERVLLNWLSVVEAGYHPNPYHNSMHAADVMHVAHYVISQGGLARRCRATDEEIFAAVVAAAVHDYNHPGINNAFHVRSQNYLAVLYNDRSVNENMHTMSVLELMRMDEYNILKGFGDTMRSDIIEFMLGTDMGLHAMFVSRFKRRLEQTDSKMHKLKADRNLALTMAVKMADISNCGRPKHLYHRWCNVIVDEFFQQGDRERLQGMPVSPFMDRHTTLMSKGQIGFMNYIVMPLFESMGEYLEEMQMATIIAEENKGFWQANEDW